MTARRPGRPGGLAIGIAYDLKADHEGEAPSAGGPDDLLEELDSDSTIEGLVAALVAAGHVPIPMGGGRSLLERLLSEPPELVFNIAEGRGGRSREAQVPAACEMLGIPCTHSDALACALTLDKPLAKTVVAAAGVRTPRWTTIESAVRLDSLDLGFPVIAKPAFEGSSMGIRRTSRSEDVHALRADVHRLLSDYRQPVIVEEFCPGPELTVGILGTGAGARVLGVMGIEPLHVPASEFVYSLEVKREWESHVRYACPPRVEAAAADEAAGMALQAYRALGCRDVGRVDLRLDAEGRPCFIELNPLPGLNPITGDVVILAGRMGMPHERLIATIVDEARTRCGI